MKNFIVLLFLFQFFQSQAQSFPAPNPLPNPRDVRALYRGLNFDTSPNTVQYENDDDVYRLLNEVMFIFPDYSSAGWLAGHEIVINFGDGTGNAVVTPGCSIVHSYPINTQFDTYHYQVRLALDGIAVDFFYLYFNKSYAVNGANFTPPNLVVTGITSPLLVDPPVMGAFPDGANNKYNGNTLGAADLYIQYAPAHNGKLIKPVIFVDGIDFSETVYTYNGQTVRRGSTGWDIFQYGNTGSKANFDNDIMS